MQYYLREMILRLPALPNNNLWQNGSKILTIIAYYYMNFVLASLSTPTKDTLIVRPYFFFFNSFITN